MVVNCYFFSKMYVCVCTYVYTCAWVCGGEEGATRVSAPRKSDGGLEHHTGVNFRALSIKHPDPERKLIKINSMMEMVFQFSYYTTDPLDGYKQPSVGPLSPKHHPRSSMLTGQSPDS